MDQTQADSIDSSRAFFEKHFAYYEIAKENHYISPADLFNEYLFPTTNSPIDSFYIRWFSYQLYGLEETSLFDKNPEYPIFRFLWLRTFHPPVLIKLEKLPDQVRYTAKITDGLGGYYT